GFGGISKLHGQKMQRGERLYVPLFHPAAALHNGSLLRTLEEDMAKVRRYLDEAAAARARAAAEIAAHAAVSRGPSTPSGTKAGDEVRPAADQLSLF
ncbi:MAG TPA: hypothetical protein VE219_06025, partial [Candidatus Sulfotelmatobacter sp.]|nr:hypothetical protein [Candidatus Sulfotelmatobacter sp.]